MTVNKRDGHRIGTLLLLLAVGAVLLAGFVPRLPVARVAAVPTPTATPGAFQPANTKIGLHTRLTDEPDPGKIKREFKMLREMGATWATEFFPWAYIQPSDRLRYDWAHADAVADAARDAGITLIARIDGVPNWA